METNILKNLMTYGIPNSTLSKDFLPLRDPKIDVSYFTTYRKLNKSLRGLASVYLDSLYNNAPSLIKDNIPEETSVILPLFSYCSYLFYIEKKHNNDKYIIGSDKFENLKITKDDSFEQLFYNMEKKFPQMDCSIFGTAIECPELIIAIVGCCDFKKVQESQHVV